MTASVYVIHDAAHRTLYVGMSITPALRVATHLRKQWGEQIAGYSVVGTFSRALAEQIEHDIIVAIQPPYNVASKDGLRAVERARQIAQRRFVRDDINKIKASAA